MPSVNTLLIAIQISSLIRCFPGRFPGEALEVLGPGKIRDEGGVFSRALSFQIALRCDDLRLFENCQK